MSAQKAVDLFAKGVALAISLINACSKIMKTK